MPVPRRSRTVRPAAAAAAAALALVVAVVAWTRSAGSGEAVQLAPRTSVDRPPVAATSLRDVAVTGSPGPSAAAAASPSTAVVVDVEGRIRRPGLQRLPPGARVADALRAAGGMTAGAVATGLNLARVLSDGEQVVVPGPGDPVPAAAGGAPGGPAGARAGGASGGSGAAAPVDLNAADQDGLDALPGVGPVLAGRILAWREQHGRFSSVDELAEVPGIGPKVLERLRPLVRV